jgi:glutathione S-transferase
LSMKLLEFPHSHYCEKARWALDYKNIPFQAIAIMPGLHLITVRRYAPGTSVPVLMANGEIVQGSSEIINYLEEKYPLHPLTPTDNRERLECFRIENTVGEVLGVAIRRILYDSLLAYPNFIRHCFTHPMPHLKQLLFRLYYPILRYLIYQVYVVSDIKVELARRKLDRTMERLERRLNRRKYLVGEHFTRADLTVASMLSFLAMPPEHPFPWQQIPDPQARIIYTEYQHHPVIEWVKQMYKHHRLRDQTGTGDAEF